MPDFNGEPRTADTRRFVGLTFDYDQRDRVIVPTSGTYLRGFFDTSLSGLDFQREQIEAGHSLLLGARNQKTLSARLSLGASQGSLPFYAQFNPGGWRENYGFMSYGLASPDYVLFAANYRQSLLDLGPLQLFGEIGATGARTALSFTDLHRARTRFGGGASLIAVNNLLGPITLGYHLNNEQGHAVFILVGYPLDGRW
jgi:outer membrane protein assembly factor BamA